MVNPSIFREYDIRGIADKDLTDVVVNQLGKAFGSFMIREGRAKIVVGRDVRLSSSRLSTALIAGLTNSGVDVIDIGVVPTPANYFAILHYAAEGGIMITGSHNPIEYNGFKMSRADNGICSVFGKDIQILKDMIVAEDFEEGNGKVEKCDVVSQYMDDLEKRITIGRRLRIVIDAGNGTGGEIAPALFEKLGCEVIRLYCEPDGTFPNHLPDPTVPKYVKDLQQCVLDNNADVGIGLDGDSDRVGVIDNKGRMMFADNLVAVFAKDVLTRHPGAQILFDVKCSQALPEIIEKHGGKPLMWKTGHSILKAKMKELNSPLAGEMSGHIFIKDGFHGYDDGIFAAGRILQILAAGDQQLAEIHDSLPAYKATPEIRVDCADENKFKIIAALADDFRASNDVIEIDGVRVLFEAGWGLVRASNTQPVIVLRFEARTEEALRKIVAIFKEKLNDHPEVTYNAEDFFGY